MVERLETLLSVATLAAHLMAVAFGSAAPLVVLALDLRAAGDADSDAAKLAQRLGRQSIHAMLVGGALGLVALALLWQRGAAGWFSVWGQIPTRRLWFTAVEFFVSLAAMAFYLALWRQSWQHRSGRRWRLAGLVRRMLTVIASTNLVYHFPLLFIVVAEAQTRPELRGASLGSAAFGRLFLDGEVLARIAHFVLLGLLATGLWLLWTSIRPPRAGLQTAAPLANRYGVRVSLAAAGMLLPSGLALLLLVSTFERDALLGGSGLATGYFGVAVCAGVVLLQRLAGVSHDTRRAVCLTMGVAAVAVVAMVAARNVHRNHGAVHPPPGATTRSSH
jgi:hypothetical protein